MTPPSKHPPPILAHEFQAPMGAYSGSMVLKPYPPVSESLYMYYHLVTAVVDCGSLNDPTDGRVQLTTTTYNSMAEYACNTGYNLNGSSIRTCREDGEWSGNQPTCQSKW